MRTRAPAIAAVGLFVSAALLSAPVVQRRDSRVGPWQADNGDGTYKNPVLFADYSDPDVVRVGSDFYLTASSFNCVPGLPVLHSRDLVNWTIIGHALAKQPPADVFARPQHGNGVWAPAIRHHNGEFFILYGDPDYGIYMVKARNPAGPWSEPLPLRAAKGWIDPAPFWDDDGQAYLVRAWARSRSGVQSILTLHRMSADATRLLDDGQLVFDGRANHPTIEGPKLYKRNGYYYIFAPAGGVTNGWQTVLRSKNIYGPYEDRIVMERGATAINGPHQGGWVELESGEHWFMHFQDRGPYGRVVHLQPMKWVNDWPVIGEDADDDGIGQPVAAHTKPATGSKVAIQIPQTSDEFSTRAASLQWQWHANPVESWSSLSARPGWLRLPAQPQPGGGTAAMNLWAAPNLLLQKFPAPQFTVTTRLDFTRLASGETAGLLVMGMDYAFVGVERDGNAKRVVMTTRRNAHEGGAYDSAASPELTGSVVYLRATIEDGAKVQFSYGHDGRTWEPMLRTFEARAGRWIGAKVGLFSVDRGGGAGNGYADFDWFRIE